MPNEYRDPLAAALSRIDSLERENARLKKVQSDRPATAAELEAVRLENELVRLEMKHDARVRSVYGEVRPTRTTMSPRVATVAGVAMLAVGLIAAYGTHGPHGARIAIGFTLAAALIYGVLRWSAVTVGRWVREHEAQRAELLARIAELRGTAPEARVRVAGARIAPTAPHAEDGEADEEDLAAPDDAADEPRRRTNRE
jgi:hypothetical protein